MSNPLELIKLLLVTAVLEDGTVFAGRIGEDELEIVAAEGSSAHRAHDALSAIAEAMNHDELFSDMHDLRDQIVDGIPYQSDGAIDVSTLARRMGVQPQQELALLPHLTAMVKQGRIAKTPDDTYFTPED